MCFTKLAAVALIENENNTFILKWLHPFQKVLFTDGSIQFLDGCYNQFCVIGELPDQLSCIVSSVNTAFAE